MARISNNEIRLLLGDLKRPASSREEAWKLLSPDERVRAETLKVPEAAERFVRARGWLRRRLGEALEKDPAGLRFVYGPQGKPSLAEEPVSFNLSHSGDRAVLALARGREVGVDLEKIRALDDSRLIERYFSVPEAVLFRATLPEKRDEAFFHFWTAKEAFLKALGDGLSRGLRNYSISDPWERPPRLTWVGWDPEETGRWRFHRFWPGEGYIGTLAYSGTATETIKIIENIEENLQSSIEASQVSNRQP